MMDEKYFELLLAMMRLLKEQDAAGASVESAIAGIIDSFEPYLDETEKHAMAKEFVRYERLLQKRKAEEETLRRLESEEYKRIVGAFSQEDAW